MSPRELDVLEAVSKGLSNRAVGQRLFLSDQTVKFHLNKIYRKLGVANRTEATGIAHRLGLGREPRARDLAPSALHRPRGVATGRLSFRPLAHPLLLLDVLVGLGLLVIAVAAKRPPASTSSAASSSGGLLPRRFRWQSRCTCCCRFPSRSKRRSSAVSSRLPWARCWSSVWTTAAISHRPGDDLEPPPWWPEFERDFRVRASGLAPRSFAEFSGLCGPIFRLCCDA